MSKGLEWHFNDYPNVRLEDLCSDELIGLDVDGHLCIVQWDGKEKRWLDVGRDYSWFGNGLVAWAEANIPDTRKPMQSYSEYIHKKNITSKGE